MSLNLEEIKIRQQAMWSSGNYAKTAWITVPLSDILCEAIEVRPGSDVLDVASGTGHVALASARRFAHVTSTDYVPKLLEVGRARAAAELLEITFTEADAENLPFKDDSFDFVLSAIGAMFAPNQEKVASELTRVCRSGGRIGMINWTLTGVLADLFKTIASHVPPPEGLKAPVLWGSEARVRELLGDKVSDLSFTYGSLPQHFISPEHYVDFMFTNYGPTLKAFESLSQDRRELFRADIAAFATRHNRAIDGSLTYDSDYVIVLATNR